MNYAKMVRNLRKGRIVALGVEGEECFVGKVIGCERGIIELMGLDPELHVPVYERRMFAPMDQICDYEWADTLGDVFTDEDGEETDTYDHLMSFAMWWNETGNGERR